MHIEHLVAKYRTADNVKEKEYVVRQIKEKKKQQQFTQWPNANQQIKLKEKRNRGTL